HATAERPRHSPGGSLRSRTEPRGDGPERRDAHPIGTRCAARVSRSVNFLARGALAALLFCMATALPAVAQTAEPTPADAPVVAFEAAVDGHDAARAVAALSDTAVLLGADSATGT